MHISRHREIRFNKESIGAAFGAASGARSAPVDAFSVKSDYSVPGGVHSAYNYTHFVTALQHFANYFDNSYMPYISHVLLWSWIA